MPQSFEVPSNRGYPADEVVFELLDGSEEIEAKRFSADGAALIFTPEKVYKKLSTLDPGRFWYVNGPEEKVDRMIKTSGTETEHASIPELYNYVDDEVVVERIEGPTVKEAYNKGDIEAAELMGNALRELHDENIAVRDLSKADVILTEDRDVAFIDNEYSTPYALTVSKATDKVSVWNRFGWEFYDDFHEGYGGSSILQILEGPIERGGEKFQDLVLPDSAK